jgi:hypothetical protein
MFRAPSWAARESLRAEHAVSAAAGAATELKRRSRERGIGGGWLVALAMRLRMIAILAVILMPAAPARSQAAGGQLRLSSLYNVRNFGATGDGKTLDTEAISRAIRAANFAGGGAVVFPPGIYFTGTFELLSNVTLDVQVGAVIQGSRNLADYGSISEYGFGTSYGVNSTGEGQHVGIIVARNAQNIAIIGQGAIDGSADDFFDFTKPHLGRDFDAQYTRQGPDFMKSMLETSDGPVETKATGRPGTMIVFSHCQNILVRDITFRNAPNWTFHLAFSRHAVVTGIHIVNSLLLPNNDGIDCIGCSDVHFSDCDIRAGDDDFAFYDAEDVTVNSCSLVSHSAGIRLENTRYGTFSNLSIHSNRGIGIFERTGTTSNLIFSTITLETQLLLGHWWGKAEPIFIAIGPSRNGAKPGEVRDIRFSNIIGEAEGGIVMYGDPSSSIRNIFLDQVKIKIRPPRRNVSDLAGGNFDFRWTATRLSDAVFKHDIPGLYCRYIKGISLRDFTLEWAPSMPGYFSSAIECEDFAHFDVDAFKGRQSPSSENSPTIVLRRGDGVSIRNSKADPGTSTFFFASGVTGEGLFAQNDLRGAKRAFASAKNGFLLFGNNMPGELKPKRTLR